MIFEQGYLTMQLSFVLVTLSVIVVMSTAEYQICINKSEALLTDEQRLLMVLMEDYDPYTRPVFNASSPVNVYVGITLTQIFDVHEKNQVLTTNIWLDQDWGDEKLTWNPEDFGGIETLRIPCKKVWLPDIVLYNSADDYTDGYMQALAMVSSNGNVFWPPIVKLRSTCQLDITYFPFDDQTCTLKLGSWAYDGFQVDVFLREKPYDLSNYVSNGEWELLGVEARRNVVTYACCPEPFPDVTFTIHMRRKTLYYTYNVIIPCIMLSILTLLGFWMRPDSGEKITLGLTVLLAFSVFMLLIAENMPATSNYVPLIGIYLTTVMALTSFSVILAVTVSNINNRGFKEEKGVPRRLKQFITFLAKLMCMKLRYLRMKPSDSTPMERLQSLSKDQYAGFNSTYTSDSGCNLIDYENGEPTNHKDSDPNKKKRDQPHKGWDSEEILKRLQILISRDEEREKSNEIYREWQEAAEVIDRFLFYVYVIGTAVATLTMLFFIPLAKNNPL